MNSVSDLIFQSKSEAFFEVFENAMLWQDRNTIDRIQRDLKKCLDEGDVTSFYFDSLRSQLGLLKKLNGAFEEILIMNKFDPEFLIHQLIFAYKAHQSAKTRVREEFNAFELIKDHPSLHHLFGSALEHELYSFWTSQYKLQEIHSFLRRHYGHIDKVKSALVFYPSRPLKKT